MDLLGLPFTRGLKLSLDLMGNRPKGPSGRMTSNLRKHNPALLLISGRRDRGLSSHTSARSLARPPPTNFSRAGKMKRWRCPRGKSPSPALQMSHSQLTSIPADFAVQLGDLLLSCCDDSSAWPGEAKRNKTITNHLILLRSLLLCLQGRKAESQKVH